MTSDRPIGEMHGNTSDLHRQEVGGGTKHAGRGTYDLNKPKAPGLFLFFFFFCDVFKGGESIIGVEIP